jgi:transposase InsO family protein
MCKILGISRSTIYYKNKPKIVDTNLENLVIKEFDENRKCFGTRKLKVNLLKNYGIIVSRRKICKIMKKYNLVSKYTIRNFKQKRTKCNEEKKENIVNRKFKNRKIREVVVSDLTYVDIHGKWGYICLLVDLAEREIIGQAAGLKKDAKLVKSAFYTVQGDLNNIKIFHTDRGGEFKNEIIDEIIETFGITRSLSRKGNPYDNAVSESMYSILKTEFVGDEKFQSLEDLQLKLFDYVNWYNNRRPHGSLNYLTPVAFKSNLSE